MAFSYGLPVSGELNLWDVKTRKLTGTLTTDLPIKQFTLSNDGNTLMVLGLRRDAKTKKFACEVTVWDIPTRKQKFVLQGHDNKVSSLALSPDGKVIATGWRPVPWKQNKSSRRPLEGSELNLWDASSGKLLRSLVDNGPHVFCLAFSPDGKHLAAGGQFWRNKSTRDNVVRLWNVPTGELEGEIAVRIREPNPRYLGVVNCLAFSRDGKILAAGTATGLSLWDLSKNKITFMDGGAGFANGSVLFSPDGKSLYQSASGDHPDNDRVVVVDLDTRKYRPNPIRRRQRTEPNLTFRLPHGTSVSGGSSAIDLDSKTSTLATCGYTNEYTGKSGLVRLWDANTGKLINIGKTAGEVRSVLFTPDGKTLIAGGTGPRRTVLKIIDLKTGHELATMNDAANPQFGPDGKLIATRGSTNWKNSLTLRRTQTGQQVAKISHADIQSISFTPNGKTLATTGGKTVKLWDLSAFMDEK